MTEMLILLLALAVGYFAAARMSRKRHYRECALILEHRAAAEEWNPRTLEECPRGLFRFEDGYGFKSQYCTEGSTGWQSDAYCLESGEYFWGGAKSAKEREALIVRPVSFHSLNDAATAIREAANG